MDLNRLMGGTKSSKTTLMPANSRKLDKKKVRKFFQTYFLVVWAKSRNTKARILKREPTLTKLPEAKRMEAAAAEIEKAAAEQKKHQSDGEDEGSNDTLQANTMDEDTKSSTVHPAAVELEGDLQKRRRSTLEARMTEITHVFDKGIESFLCCWSE
jgi:hypothetical protein